MVGTVVLLDGVVDHHGGHLAWLHCIIFQQISKIFAVDVTIEHVQVEEESIAKGKGECEGSYQSAYICRQTLFIVYLRPRKA